MTFSFVLPHIQSGLAFQWAMALGGAIGRFFLRQDTIFKGWHYLRFMFSTTLFSVGDDMEVSWYYLKVHDYSLAYI